MLQRCISDYQWNKSTKEHINLVLFPIPITLVQCNYLSPFLIPTILLQRNYLASFPIPTILVQRNYLASFPIPIILVQCICLAPFYIPITLVQPNFTAISYTNHSSSAQFYRHFLYQSLQYSAVT